MQPGRVGHYSGLVCEPSQYVKGSQVHHSHLVPASGELGVNGMLWQLLPYTFEPSTSRRLHIVPCVANRALGIHKSFS